MSFFDVRLDHRGTLDIHGNRKNLEIWPAMFLIKRLPNWQVIAAPSPTTPALNQQPLPAKLSQRDLSATDSD
jgi:hypothetical protein